MTDQRLLISNGNPMEKTVGFSRAVRVGSFIAIGGTAPVDPDGRTVGVGDVHAQTIRCFEIIKDALVQAGSGLHDIVRTRVILTVIDNWKAAIEARKAFCLDAHPVDPIMAVTRFVNPNGWSRSKLMQLFPTMNRTNTHLYLARGANHAQV